MIETIAQRRGAEDAEGRRGIQFLKSKPVDPPSLLDSLPDSPSRTSAFSAPLRWVPLLALLIALPHFARAGKFTELGVPVRKAGLMGALVGPGIGTDHEWLYFNYNQDGAPLFLVAVDPATGASRMFNSPKGPGAWGFILGPDKRIYFGTWDGGLALRFDPAAPDKGIEVLGAPSETESYIWMYTIGADGKLYGCTYPHAKLVSVDPATGAMADLGVMDATQQYARSLAASPDGFIYVGTGFAKANVVAFDPKTGKSTSLIAEADRKSGVATITTGADGKVYARIGEALYRCEGAALAAVPPAEYPGDSVAPRKMRDGTILGAWGDGFYILTKPDGSTSRGEFKYEGEGSRVFVVGKGPGGVIYGSTAMPLEMFSYDPAGGKLADLGNPTAVGGELYSILPWERRLYVCAYPGGYMSVYDPARPWAFGTAPESNPRGLGGVGDGHLRPRAMIAGPGGMIYVGSYPPYGQLGGAMGVFDPATNKTVENHRNIVKDQSVSALAYDSASGLVFGGSDVIGGGGSTPTEKQAKFFAWDPKEKKIVFEGAPVEGDTSIVSLAVAGGKVFGVSQGSNSLFAFDIVSRKLGAPAKLPAGGALPISLLPHKDGKLYGLGSKAIFRVDPATGAAEIVDRYEPGIGAGMALTDDAIYFGSGVKLVKYEF